jgi:hypothetical protein
MARTRKPRVTTGAAWRRARIALLSSTSPQVLERAMAELDLAERRLLRMAPATDKEAVAHLSRAYRLRNAQEQEAAEARAILKERAADKPSNGGGLPLRITGNTYACQGAAVVILEAIKAVYRSSPNALGLLREAKATVSERPADDAQNIDVLSHLASALFYWEHRHTLRAA